MFNIKESRKPNVQNIGIGEDGVHVVGKLKIKKQNGQTRTLPLKMVWNM